MPYNIEEKDAQLIGEVNGLYPSAYADALGRFAYEAPDEPFSVWLPKQRENAPHWWKPEPKTPSKEDEDAAVFHSADAQAAYAKANGADALAAKLAERELKPGHVLKRTKEDAATTFEKNNKAASNPWHPQYRGKNAEAERIRICTQSASLASRLAAAAGVTLSGQPLKKK